MRIFSTRCFYRFLLLWGVLGTVLQAHGKSAGPTIRGDFRQLRFEEFARRVEAPTPYRFYFKPETVDSVRVNLQAADQPLAVVLQQILSPTGLRFAIDAANRVYITAGQAVQTQLPADFFDAPKPGSAPAAGPALTVRAEGPGKPRPGGTSKFKVYEVGPRQGLAPGGKATLAGHVLEAQSGEPVVGASVYIDSPNVGVATDQFGSYALTLPTGRHTLNIRGIGIKASQRQIVLYADGKLNIQAQEDVTTLKEVVESEKARNVAGLRMGVVKLDIKTIKSIPTAFGEADVLRVVLMLPGVKAIGEGSTGMSVRGGGTDQNLVLFNDATIYNPSHLFGFFSAFNPEVLKSVELYKGSVPARYGGRLASVLDIVTREGNKKKLAGNGGVGLLTSRFTLEGPLVKDKGSFIIGGRTSYSDWLLHQVPDASLKNSSAGFYDASAHFRYDLNDRNAL